MAPTRAPGSACAATTDRDSDACPQTSTAWRTRQVLCRGPRAARRHADSLTRPARATKPYSTRAWQVSQNTPRSVLGPARMTLPRPPMSLLRLAGRRLHQMATIPTLSRAAHVLRVPTSEEHQLCYWPSQGLKTGLSWSKWHQQSSPHASYVYRHSEPAQWANA